MQLFSIRIIKIFHRVLLPRVQQRIQYVVATTISTFNIGIKHAIANVWMKIHSKKKKIELSNLAVFSPKEGIPPRLYL